MASKLVNALLLALLTLLVLVLNTRPSLDWAVAPLGTIAVHMTPRLTLILIEVLAFCVGMAQAFGIPAGTAILPYALPASLLEGANGVLMGLRQLAMLVGPLLAALLVGTTRHGLAWAFAADCISFIVSAWTLSRVACTSARQRLRRSRYCARWARACNWSGAMCRCACVSCTGRWCRSASAAPLSAVGAGWLLTWMALPDLFLAGGVLLMAMAASAWLFTPMRHFLVTAPNSAG